MQPPQRSASFTVPVVLTLLAAPLFLAECGGGGGGGGGSATSAAMTGQINVSLSDPPTCKPPDGDFEHVWVTVTKVRAHISTFASDGDDDDQDESHDVHDDDHNDDDHGDDGKWVTLIDLTQHPMQIDLLSADDTTCILANLGVKQGIPAGKYEQIRFHLLANHPNGNEPKPPVNHCQGVDAFNCVDTLSVGVKELLLGGNGNKGFKIPPGQIAGGALHLAHGEKADLNIDFDACKSIVKQGNGKYRLKPTLHAGEVSVNKGVVTGRLVDAANGLALTGGHFVVLAEQADATGVHRVVAQKTVDASSGTFNLCPLAIGAYTFVVAGQSSGGATYGPTVVFDVPTGTALGDISLHRVPGATSAPARIDGLVTTSAPGNVATGADVEITALQPAAPSGGAAVLVAVPSLAGSSSLLPTEDGLACTPNTKCAMYTLFVSAANPSVATFAPGGFGYAAPAGGDVSASVSARAFVPGTPILDCSPSVLIVSDDDIGGPLTIAPGATKIAGSIPFTGCTSGF